VRLQNPRQLPTRAALGVEDHGLQSLRDAVGAVSLRFLTQTNQPSVRFRMQLQQSSKHQHSSYEKYAMPQAFMSL
jgi:hypothetical protein